ncbi:glycosyltransferase [Microvirga brassicacearum]|uniref:Glycosyltransferase n=1 Tax=Microvirga brassicacearum TaxID=2580413 RepID=A0A5N3PDC9_9HYPH|nr:glycosyltransferase [Microvirga brassicacearum]KAB0267736.1 glycosyltransferase [Microvirga brassicacearum]
MNGPRGLADDRSARACTGRPQVSVLMSTYKFESAANLATSLESIEAQSILPDQLVLVVDGPIGMDQECVIADFIERAIIPMTLVRQSTNRGLAEAMNAGLCHCTGDFIMRMDSDDICDNDRLEKQLSYSQNHPDIDVIGTWSEEFFEDGAPPKIKVSPTDHEAIIQALHWRNILHHPTLLIRTSALRRVAGYRAKYGFLEDYDLFVRLALSGARFHVIPKVLTRIRSGIDQRSRRGGLRYLVNDVRFRMECLRTGFLTRGEFLATTLMYSVFRLVSGGFRRRLYALART